MDTKTELKERISINWNVIEFQRMLSFRTAKLQYDHLIYEVLPDSVDAALRQYSERDLQ